MTTQITVRIPDDLADFLDATVAEAGASGRAEIVTRALAREQRRLAAERDAAIYAAIADDRELDALAEFNATQPVDLD